MSDFDDAQLTAYALNELDDAGRRAVEARLEREPGLRAEIEHIQAVADELKTQLAAEAMPAIAAEPIRLPVKRPPRWGRRLAIAAAVSIVVGGIGIAVVLPGWKSTQMWNELSNNIPASIDAMPATAPQI